MKEQVQEDEIFTERKNLDQDILWLCKLNTELNRAYHSENVIFVYEKAYNQVFKQCLMRVIQELLP